MSAGVETQRALPIFEDAAKIGIARLSPDVSNIDQLHIEASVALIWPYSSSTRRLSLLLADRDVRLRKTKGQVRVTFHGECAREVAKTQIGIGDVVKLGFGTATWTKTGEDVATPGKKVDWDVDFSQRVQLELRRGETATFLNIIADSPSPVQIKGSNIEVNGPKSTGFIDVQKARLNGSYLSPARHKHNRHSSGSFVDATLDPFADDDVYISGRTRKRTKFARHSGAWQLMDTDQEVQVESVEDFIPPSSPLQRFVEKEAVPEQASSAVASDLLQSTTATVADEIQTASPLQHDVNTLVHDTQGEQTNQEAELSENAVSHVETDTHPQEGEVTTDTGRPHVVTSNLPESDLRRDIIDDLDPAMTPTPVLRPLPSSGLAMISPLVERRTWPTGYFPGLAGPQSELDAISHPATGSIHPAEQNSLLEYPGTASLQPEHFDAEELNISNDGEQEMLLEGHNVNDLLGSGGALHDRVNETITDLLEDAVLNEQSDTDPRSAIDLVAVHNFDVDLDALQQQIDESSQLWQESLQPLEVEDEDMYGPPSRHEDAVLPGDPILDAPDIAYVVEGTSVPSAHIHLQTMSSPIQGAIGVQTLSDQYESTQQPNTPLSPVLVESSEEESDDSEDNDDESEEESHMSSGDEEEKEDDYDAEEETDVVEENMFDTEMRTSVVPVIADHQELRSEEHPEASSPAAITVKESATSTALNSRPHDEHNLRTDGAGETYENEIERNHLRNTISLGALVNDQLSTEQAGSRSRAQSVMSEGSIGRGELQKESKTVAGEPQRSESFNDVADVSNIPEAIDDGQIQADFIEIAAAAIAEAARGLVQSPQLSDVDKPLQLVTPDATQNPTAADDLDLLQPSELLAVFPPTPTLTQGTVDLDLPSSPPFIVQSDAGKDEEDEAAAAQIQTAPLKPLPRASQRLSRKSFTSETISNQYFTPRRSSRKVQTSPLLATESLPSAVRPLSPTSARQLLGSSPPVDEQVRKGDPDTSPKTLRGRTTSMSYYPYLSCLQEFYSLQVDLIAVCTVDSSLPQRARTGPKDNYTTLCLADPSFTTENTTVRAQLFRPRKEALPTVNRGDVILLRNMKVQTHDHNTMLLSTETSSWAVFKPRPGRGFDVVINGPPVEHELGELTEAKRLLRWWRTTGEKAYAEVIDPQLSNESVQTRRSASPMVTRSQARRTPTMDNQGDDHNSSEILEPSSPLAPLLSSPTTRSKRQVHRRSNSNKSDVVIHDLRDGTKYVDGRSRQRSESVIHELRDGFTYVDE